MHSAPTLVGMDSSGGAAKRKFPKSPKHPVLVINTNYHQNDQKITQKQLLVVLLLSWRQQHGELNNQKILNKIIIFHFYFRNFGFCLSSFVLAVLNGPDNTTYRPTLMVGTITMDTTDLHTPTQGPQGRYLLPIITEESLSVHLMHVLYPMEVG